MQNVIIVEDYFRVQSYKTLKQMSQVKLLHAAVQISESFLELLTVFAKLCRLMINDARVKFTLKHMS